MSNFDMDWGNIKEPGTGEKVDFMKLQTGQNQLRVVGKPSMIDIHWEKGIDGQQKKVICPGAGCPICKAGHVPMVRYQVQVIDRTDGKIKVLEGGPTIFNAIKQYAMEPDYGDPTQYDLKIKKEGSGRETKYTVLATPQKKPLSAAEKEAVANAKPLAEVNKTKSIDEIMQMGLEILTGSVGDLADDFEAPAGAAGGTFVPLSDDDWDQL